jgi:hypothetical protein
MRFREMLMLLILALGLAFVLSARAQQATHENNPALRSSQKANQVLPPALPRAQDWPPAMQKVYMDESHCLTVPEIRTNKDNPISCYCRDAIADARYVHFTYLLPGKDANLYGTFLALQLYAGEQCSRDTAERSDADFIQKIDDATTSKDWKWSGPEVVTTFPPDGVIKRIKPSGEHGAGRWVPYTVQLVYRDAQGRVTRTEEYSTREFRPVFLEKH